MNAIKSRRPTGTVPWPLVLIEGPEKSGKSYAAAEFTASKRTGQTYWIDLGEGAADEYAVIDGADYLVIEHDGSWPDIIGQVVAVHQEAQRVAKLGGPPVVLVIDSMTAEWELLKDWVSARARESKAGRRALAQDPDAEVKPAMNLWNDANQRHAHLMHLLMTFPGIVVVTARGKEVASLDDNGRPIVGQRDYRVEGHKALAFDATAWVRLSRDAHPQVVGVRSVHAGLRPGVDKPRTVPSFSLEALIFDVMKCNPAATHVRDHVRTNAVEPQQQQYRPTNFDAIDDMIRASADVSELGKIDQRLAAFNTDRASRSRALVMARVEELKAPPAQPERVPESGDGAHEAAVDAVQETLDGQVVES